MDLKVHFSFLKLFNHLKGVSKPLPLEEVDLDWLKKRADKKTRERYRAFFKWADANGIKSPKVKYPVMFGKGDN